MTFFVIVLEPTADNNPSKFDIFFRINVQRPFWAEQGVVFGCTTFDRPTNGMKFSSKHFIVILDIAETL